MPLVDFFQAHNLDPSSSSGSLNILALLRNQANYTVVVNEPDRWIVELATPHQGIAFIELYPPAGGVFTPGSGENPPVGAVGLIIFSDAFIGDIFVQFGELAPLGFSAGQLIGDTTRLVSSDDDFIGSLGDDIFFGGAGRDRLEGLSGADTLNGGDGDDTFTQDIEDSVDILSGGAGGFDLIDYSAASGAVTVQLSGYSTTAAGDLLTVFSGIEYAAGSAFDDALIGAAGDDFFFGGSGADWIVGGGGDDWFFQGAESGVDRLFGGVAGSDSGVDTIDFQTAITGVIVQLSGYATTQSGTLVALFSGIEDAWGTNFNDALIGNGVDNFLNGREGADWLVGGGGNDWFWQGVDSGVDRLFGDSGLDFIDYFGAAAAVVVQLGGGYATSGGSVIATFTGIEDARGTDFNDSLIGSGVDNFLYAGAGGDWLVGADGNDTFILAIDTNIDRVFGGTPGADAGLSDTIDYFDASQGIAVQLSGYATTNGGSITLATFSGIENAVGSSFDDALIGNAGANRLTGGTGGDWLVGGLGADTFVYQSINDGAGDSIRDFSQTQTDRIDLSAIDARPTTGEDDPFIFATVRHAGVLGEAVVTNFGGSSLVSLYLDGDNVADMTIQVVHQPGLIMNAGDFVL